MREEERARRREARKKRGREEGDGTEGSLDCWVGELGNWGIGDWELVSW